MQPHRMSGTSRKARPPSSNPSTNPRAHETSTVDAKPPTTDRSNLPHHPLTRTSCKQSHPPTRVPALLKGTASAVPKATPPPTLPLCRRPERSLKGEATYISPLPSLLPLPLLLPLLLPLPSLLPLPFAVAFAFAVVLAVAPEIEPGFSPASHTPTPPLPLCRRPEWRRSRNDRSIAFAFAFAFALVLFLLSLKK